MLARPTPAVPFTRRRRRLRPPPSCSDGDIDTEARSSLEWIPPVPWEYLRAYLCGTGNKVTTTGLGDTQYLYPYLDYPTNTVPHPIFTNGNVCAMSVSGPVASVAYGHSHPQFEWRRDFGVTCHVGMYSENDVIAQNLANYNFSTADKSTAHSLQKSMYLVVPDRSKVSVYYKTPIGIWVTRDI